MTEIQKEAEAAARHHFRDGRDKYEKMAVDIIAAWNNPPSFLTPEQSLGDFLRGVAKNNFYYGYIAAKGEPQ